MLKRICALICALALVPMAAGAEIVWPGEKTEGQRLLRAYVERVNRNLGEMNRGQINSIFEYYTTFAVLGVTNLDMMEIPDGVELSFSLYNDSLNTLQLRVNDPSRFAPLAASCIQAASPTAITMEDAMKAPTERAKRAQDAPDNSFEDAIDYGNGMAPRVYYAYYPNQYRDGVNWLQMTLIFPLAGASDAGVFVTSSPDSAGSDAMYEGYDYDGGTHLEIFTTATPEPDSAAAEEYE